MVDVTDPPAPPEPASRWPRRAWPMVMAAALIGLVVANLFLLMQLNATNDDLATLQDSVDRVDSRLDGISGAVTDAAADAGAALGAVDQLGDRVSAAEALAAAAATPPAPESSAPVIDPGTVGLPVFDGDPANDPALGVQLAEIGGFEYYLGEEIGFDLTDGRARAIVVWSHWCPFCQDELPALSEWITQNASDFPNLGILSVTTSIDPSAANPLVPYLDDNQFPFPVLVDEEGQLARFLGVNAFPFWIFIGPDGAVLGRLTGLRGMDELGAIFAQLDALAA